LQFRLFDAFGREVRASDYRGSPLLIVAGACWCGGCQQDAEVLRGVEQKYRARGLEVIRSTSLDNELPAWEFQKHYRLPVVQLIDPVREFERRYNPDGWTFLMLADGEGRVVYRANCPIDWPGVEARLDSLLAKRRETKTIARDGVWYVPAVLERSGETDAARRRDVFPSLACASNGRKYVCYTTDRNGTHDVYVRVFDGRAWLPDRPVAATEADEFDGAIAVDAEGRAWISWTSNQAGPLYDVFVARLPGASEKIEPVQVTRSDDDAMHARLAADAKGRVWVTYYRWAKMGGRSRDKEVYTRWLDGSRLSEEIHVSPSDVPVYEDHFDPAIVTQGDSVFVGWSWDYHRPKGYSPVPQSPSIFLRRVDPGGLGPVRAVSGPECDTRPTLGAGSNGWIVCAWESVTRHRDGLRKVICTSVEDPAQEEQPGTGVDVSGLKENVCTPSLAMSPAGEAALVWSEVDAGGKWTLKQVAWSGKSGWGTAKTLLAQGNPRFASPAFDEHGRLWVACSVEREHGREIEVIECGSGRGY